MTVNRLAMWLRQQPPARVLAAFVVTQWVEVAVLAAKIRHAGWLFYQGGDQLWYYTIGWLLVHGRFSQPGVGYLWSTVMAPFALVAGPNVLNALPGIILLQVVILLPIVLVTLYAIASRLAGRIFAYWTLLLWLVVPVFGILYTNTGYHQKYTELLLPQAFGLTGMADFVTLTCTLVSVYFCMRALVDDRPSLFHAAAAGVAAGATIAVKPSGALFLGGVALAFVSRPRVGPAAVFTAGLAPAAAVLAFWKLRGFGHLPFAAAPPHAGALLGASAPVLALGLHNVFHFDWSHLSHEFDLLREHFWSGRVIQWMPVAGTIGLARRSRPGVLLIAGWFGAYVLAKGTYIYASIEDGSLLRIMIPAFPAFILLLASIVFVIPRAVHRFEPEPGRPEPVLGPRARGTVLGAAVLLTSIVPFVAIAAASPERGPRPIAAIVEQPPIPTEVDLGLYARHVADGIELTWRAQHPAGGPVFFQIYRMPADTPEYSCAPGRSAQRCVIDVSSSVAVVRGTRYVDHPPAGTARWRYRIGVAADWLNDTAFGDAYEISSAVVIAAR